MADQLLQGGNVFEITDHTTASNWERFIASIEDVLTEWGLFRHSQVNLYQSELPKGLISSGLWHEKHDLIKFGNSAYDLRYQYLVEPNRGIDNLSVKNSFTSDGEKEQQDSIHSDDSESEFHDAPTEGAKIPKQTEREYGEHELPDILPECLIDLTSTANDFASKAHCLVRWYNFRRFIILTPRGDTIVSEDRAKLVLSSASIALSNIDCHVPIFVQTHNPKNNFFQGVSEHLNIRTMYEMIFSKQGCNQYGYLSELISLFREKTGCNLNDPISVSIRLNYCLDIFDLFVNPTEEFDGNEHSDDDDQDELIKMTSSKKKTSNAKNQDMRSGASFEMVKDALNDCLPHPFRILKYLHVAALWPPISDKVITDSRVHSDLDPAEAPIWTIRCVTNDNCNMKIVHETQAVYELFLAAIRYAYDKLDASQIFNDSDREQLEVDCLKLSYNLATRPEVILSENPSDKMRKLIALMFFRASEIRSELDDLARIADKPKKRPSLSEIYRDFNKNKPSVKEFIIRTNVPRPFSSIISPALPQRMFCTICDDEFRLCGAFSESCN